MLKDRTGTIFDENNPNIFKKKKKSAEKTSVVRSILERMRLLVGARCALGGCLSSFSLFRIAMRTGKILSADPLALPGF